MTSSSLHIIWLNFYFIHHHRQRRQLHFTLRMVLIPPSWGRILSLACLNYIRKQNSVQHQIFRSKGENVDDSSCPCTKFECSEECLKLLENGEMKDKKILFISLIWLYWSQWRNFYRLQFHHITFDSTYILHWKSFIILDSLVRINVVCKK